MKYHENVDNKFFVVISIDPPLKRVRRVSKCRDD